MSVLETILSAQGGNVIKQMAQANGIDPEAALSVIGKLVPSLTQQVETQAAGSTDGMNALLNALKTGHHERYLENSEAAFTEAARLDGNGILSHLLGSKDNSREVASNLANSTGVSTSIVKKMLPQAAALVMGALSKQNNPRGALANIEQQSPTAAQGLLTSFLDRDKDGSIVDDVMALAARTLFR